MRDKILVVDDDPAARRIIVQLFEASAEVLEASNGADALKMVEAQRPRLMILDMTMPGMSGLEVLKARQTSAVAVVTLVVTGRDDIELAKQALALGAAEYITKPFDLDRLLGEVERILRPSGKPTARPWRIRR